MGLGERYSSLALPELAQSWLMVALRRFDCALRALFSAIKLTFCALSSCVSSCSRCVNVTALGFCICSDYKLHLSTLEKTSPSFVWLYNSMSCPTSSMTLPKISIDSRLRPSKRSERISSQLVMTRCLMA